MAAREFGLWVDKIMRSKGIKPLELTLGIGRLSDGRLPPDATGVRLIRHGRRREYDTELVVRIALALGEDPDYACKLAGVFPPNLEVEHVKRARFLATVGSDPAASSRKHRLVFGRAA